MKPGIDRGISPIVLAPQTLLVTAKEEVTMNTASSGAWINRTPRKIIRTGVDRITPGNILNTVSVVESTSIVLVVIVATYTPWGLNTSQ